MQDRFIEVSSDFIFYHISEKICIFA